MERTQIYLTSEQKARLEAIARSKSVSMADIVRDAVSQYLAGGASERKDEILRETFGAIKEWADRDGVALTREIRAQWSRPEADGQVKASTREEPRS